MHVAEQTGTRVAGPWMHSTSATPLLLRVSLDAGPSSLVADQHMAATRSPTITRAAAGRHTVLAMSSVPPARRHTIESACTADHVRRRSATSVSRARSVDMMSTLEDEELRTARPTSFPLPSDVPNEVMRPARLLLAHGARSDWPC